MIKTLGLALLLVWPGHVAPYHPLGNFTISHYNGLRLHPDRVENTAVVDFAELPTLQDAEAVDGDRDGRTSPAELDAYAITQCGVLAAAQTLRAGERPLTWQVMKHSFRYESGEGGLRTSRLSCELIAPASLRRATAVEFADAYLTGRPGWREITATGSGVRLTRPPVPSVSVSDELRRYPEDLLALPLDQRSVTLTTEPGTGAGGTVLTGLPAPDVVTRALNRLDETFTGLVGGDRLTVPLGFLAIALAMVLGAGHALIPGHGKTIMAAYLAGRRGRPGDAVTVGLTVTATHTGGVLVVGLLLSLSATLTGESVLSWLGLASGLLITGIGCALLRTAWRQRRTGPSAWDVAGHGHAHGHAHTHERGHGHGHAPAHSHSHEQVKALALVGAADTENPRPDPLRAAAEPVPAHHPDLSHCGRPARRAGLIGMGIAGGLVPSPSALVVLLGAVALGRTWFGVLLVVAYGLGMAATLTAAGLLLVRVAARLEGLMHRGNVLAARIQRIAPFATAAVVVLLGAGLALRSLPGILHMY
ncbi:nickel/cobalt transporter [Rhizohabitans arisaemae]|uniref:nickel/cobalt transporter n=1 Tax=Rhizohabitans arisaemae TaxID=2720610 RepID=UPI0024B07CB2|nr:High-affinity nickel-transporter [Rhizohabitans arisaemae]